MMTGNTIGALLLFSLLNFTLAQTPWTMHTIDSSSKGADGAKLMDVDQDGLQDIIVGWEQGNVVRLYHHPSDGSERQSWPYIEVPAPNVEDAQAVDLNGDGFPDLVSCSEGGHQRIAFHFAPSNQDTYWTSQAWTSIDVPCTIDRTRWMFARPMDVDHRNGIDLIVGSKNPNGTIGWLESPENPEDVSAWKYHEISPAGWIMSIEIVDMDEDGQKDILISDRKGEWKGVKWFKHPGRDEQAMKQPWQANEIGLGDKEPMFLDVFTDLKREVSQIWVATHKSGFYGYVWNGIGEDEWQEYQFDFPAQGGEIGKSISLGYVDGDSDPDFVSTHVITTYEGVPKAGKGGVGVVLSTMRLGKKKPKQVKHVPIGDGTGSKFDFAQLVDIDGDGDLDVLTCEEANNATQGNGLGVIWYENPGNNPKTHH